MTSGPALGTSYDQDKVIKAAKKVGFNEPTDGLLYRHNKVDDLVLQIHPPGYFKGVEGVVTEIEFCDFTEQFPNNPPAVEVLRLLYEELPDLKYREIAYPSNKFPIGPLSELLDSLE